MLLSLVFINILTLLNMHNILGIEVGEISFKILFNMLEGTDILGFTHNIKDVQNFFYKVITEKNMNSLTFLTSKVILTCLVYMFFLIIFIPGFNLNIFQTTLADVST